jgi:Outer membrane protein beta-barrel domain
MYGRMHGLSTRAAVTLAALTFSATLDAQRTPARPTSTKPAAAPAAANELVAARGLQLGVYTLAAPGVSITGEDVDGTFRTNFGGGAGVMVGYGFNPIWSGYAALDVAKQGSGNTDQAGTFGLAHFEIGARANLALGNPTTVPYLSASVGRRALGAHVTDYEYNEEYDMALSGMMFGVGGGIQHMLSPKMALDAGVQVGYGRFAHLDQDGEQSTLLVNGSTSVRLRVGVNWRP